MVVERQKDGQTDRKTDRQTKSLIKALLLKIQYDAFSYVQVENKQILRIFNMCLYIFRKTVN